jgi:hypothetical protein
VLQESIQQTNALFNTVQQLTYQSQIDAQQLVELRQQAQYLSMIMADMGYQTDIFLSINQELDFQTDRLIDLYNETRIQTQLQRDMVEELEYQGEVLDQILTELQNDQELETVEPRTFELPEWAQHDITAEAWDWVTASLSQTIDALVAQASTKAPFALAGWIPIVSLSGAGNCESINMTVLGTQQDVSVCSSPIHTIMATTVRAALLALILIGFYVSTAWGFAHS